jgi:hypothetical protein
MISKRRTFDLETEARRLYQTAKAKADFTGATSVLRLLRDLRPAGGGKPAADNRWLDWQTADEKNELDAAFDSIARLKRLATARCDLGLDPPVSYLVGGEPKYWRDTPETDAESRARYTAAKSAAPITDPVPTATEVEEPLSEDEIDVSDLIADGVDLSWIPDEEPS